ncbi:hypothetical protein [Mycoplasma sp. CSL7503-lung]|uniref:hypothetical protein n=1 Tax=Mycoplasma sp. CSL7503-lung TaxID=536372 RepID=UPI0021D09F25|nr:hypothetical protein [Mycoplasma sp. CSL7503-lung]MCU4706596.1 hypothetical protein [Mycoplasma sp. CSL7503-lung]
MKKKKIINFLLSALTLSSLITLSTSCATTNNVTNEDNQTTNESKDSFNENINLMNELSSISTSVEKYFNKFSTDLEDKFIKDAKIFLENEEKTEKLKKENLDKYNFLVEYTKKGTGLLDNLNKTFAEIKNDENNGFKKLNGLINFYLRFLTDFVEQALKDEIYTNESKLILDKEKENFKYILNLFLTESINNQARKYVDKMEKYSNLDSQTKNQINLFTSKANEYNLNLKNIIDKISDPQYVPNDETNNEIQNNILNISKEMLDIFKYYLSEKYIFSKNSNIWSISTNSFNIKKINVPVTNSNKNEEDTSNEQPSSSETPTPNTESRTETNENKTFELYPLNISKEELINKSNNSKEINDFINLQEIKNRYVDSNYIVNNFVSSDFYESSIINASKRRIDDTFITRYSKTNNNQFDKVEEIQNEENEKDLSDYLPNNINSFFKISLNLEQLMPIFRDVIEPQNVETNLTNKVLELTKYAPIEMYNPKITKVEFDNENNELNLFFSPSIRENEALDINSFEKILFNKNIKYIFGQIDPNALFSEFTYDFYFSLSEENNRIIINKLNEIKNENDTITDKTQIKKIKINIKIDQ